jgi:hypothetical protein
MSKRLPLVQHYWSSTASKQSIGSLVLMGMCAASVGPRKGDVVGVIWGVLDVLAGKWWQDSPGLMAALPVWAMHAMPQPLSWARAVP